MSVIDHPHFRYALYGPDGEIHAGLRNDGQFAVGSLGIGLGADITMLDHPHFRYALYGPDGEIHAGLRRDGMFAAGGLQVGFSGEVVSAEHPEFGFFIADADGVIVAGATRDGKWLPEGSGGGGDAPLPQTVETVFVEPWLDPSENLIVSWVSDSAEAKEMEYRQAGTSTWFRAESVRSRPFPVLTGKYVHSVVLVGLSPETIYQVRFPGASHTDKFRTCPKSGIRMAVISDHQDTDYSETAHMRVLAEDVRNRGADIMGFIGDLANDDGQFNAARTQRWVSLLDAISTEFRKEGALIPWFGVTGNHEGAKHDGSPNAETGGDGIIGHIATLLSWSYFEEHPSRLLNSAATFGIGSELFVITLETDHTEHLEDQFDWLVDQVAAAYDKYDHIVIAGHFPAFIPYAAVNDVHYETGKKLRHQMYPALAPYADKISCYVCGHTHILAVTPPLQVDYDPQLSDEENDGRYTEDPVNGIVQLGTGPVQYPAFRLDRGDETSALDGSRMFRAAMGRNISGNVNDPPEIAGTGITNPPADAKIQHYWMFDYSDGFTATAYGLHHLPYYVHQKGQ